MNFKLLTIFAILGGAFVTSGSALADKINAKTGLWEMSVTTDTAGLPKKISQAIPPEVFAQMPPEQRARLEEILKGSSLSGGLEQKSKACVTEKDLERSFRPQDQPGQTCKETSSKVIGTTREIHVECIGDKYKSTGVMKMNTPNRETVDGTMDMTMNNGSNTINMKIDIKGKWLSADCGDVKPYEQ